MISDLEHQPAGDQKFMVTENAMRPASPKRECFYCHRVIGLPHKDDCVLIQKKVKLRFIVEYETTVPDFWDKDQIEFHRNESSSCKNNDFRILEAMSENPCMCEHAKIEFVESLSGPFVDER